MQGQTRPSCTRYLQIAKSAAYTLLIIAGARFWIAPLGSSLWRDEAGTLWTIKDGLGQMLVRLQAWPSISAAYGIVCWVAYTIGGAKEYVLRLPSAIAVIAAAWLVHRLAKRLFGYESAFPAAVVFASCETVIFAGADARPYAVAVLAATGSTFLLVRWLAGGALSDAAGYVITAALAVHIHYFVFPVLGAHAAYALVRLHEGSPVRLKGLLVSAACTAALIVPLWPVFIRLARNRQAHSYLDSPTVLSLAEACAPAVLLCSVALGLCAAKLICGRIGVEPWNLPRSTAVLLASIGLGPVLLIFGISTLSSAHIFLPRYFISSQIGLALFAGWAIGRIRPEMARWVLMISILLCAIAAFGSWRHLWPPHNNEDWRAAMATERQIVGDPATPVLFQSGFIESSTENLDLRTAPGFLTAPLSIYPAAGRVIVLPYKFGENSRPYVESVVSQLEGHRSRFVLVTCNGDFWRAWLAGRFQNYTSSTIGGFGKITVTVFQAR
jgi:dolichyl-phosphate-mannose-protein mannosyltransferase